MACDVSEIFVTRDSSEKIFVTSDISEICVTKDSSVRYPLQVTLA